jgi:hypothetical protein
MFVVRRPDGQILWMDVSAHLNRRVRKSENVVALIGFVGEPFTAQTLSRLRDGLVPLPGS